MTSRRLVLASCVLALGVATAPAATLNPGGGPKVSDCMAEFGPLPVNYPVARPVEIRCTDGDATCDSDPTPNQCGFQLYACLNVIDPRIPECTTQTILEFAIRNWAPTSAGYDPGFTILQDQVRAMLPIPPTTHDVCTTDGGQPPVTITVPLKLVAGTYRKANKTLHTHLDWQLRNGFRDDFDTIRMTCLPASP